MDELESATLGAAVDEDEELLADKQQRASTGEAGGDDMPAESVSLNF
jgi:hypothetical protein